MIGQLSPRRAYLGGTTGVRPSPGAAGSDTPSTLESSGTPLLVDVAAPDGRTPTRSFLILSFTSSFYRERLKRLLRLPTTDSSTTPPTPAPAAAPESPR